MPGVISTFSLVVVAVTLVANSIQAREVLKQTRVSTMANEALLYQNVEAAMCEFNKLLYANPRHRACIYGDAPLPDDPVEAEKVTVLAEMFVDLANRIVRSGAFFDADDRATWYRYFTDLAGRSRVVQDYWSEHRAWYQKPTRRVLDPAVLHGLAARGIAPAWQAEPPAEAAGHGHTRPRRTPAAWRRIGSRFPARGPARPPVPAPAPPPDDAPADLRRGA